MTLVVSQIYGMLLHHGFKPDRKKDRSQGTLYALLLPGICLVVVLLMPYAVHLGQAWGQEQIFFAQAARGYVDGRTGFVGLE
jgi:hypothetical protein